MRIAFRGMLFSAWYANAHTCEDICNELSSCSKGSYCKGWQSVPVCFGLYYLDGNQSGMCYFPDDPLCPESYPVECPTDHPELVKLNVTEESSGPQSSTELDVPIISLAMNETNSTWTEVPTKSNMTSSIEVFDWVADNPIEGNSTTQNQL